MPGDRAALGGHGPPVLRGERLGGSVGSSPGDSEDGIDEINALRHTLLDQGSDLLGRPTWPRHATTVRRMRRPRQVAVLLLPALLAGCGLVSSEEPVAVPAPTAAAPTEPALDDFYAQQPTWVNCGPADCARIEVPRDYDDPTGERLELGITRVRATGERLGSLFVNPGGPGASAFSYAKRADSIVGPSLREHFDIIGVDPRGVGVSTPIECLTDAERDELAAFESTPDSAAEERALLAMSRLPAVGCATASPDLIAHVGTVDTARDLDIARAVVGDPTLQYLGKSYGTFIGATYAELFPTRVGRMVLDGVLPADLSAAEITRGQAIGFEEVLREFIADCLTVDDCPLEGDVDAAAQQLREWLSGLDAAPLRSGDRELNEALAAYAVLTNLYVPEYDFPRLREALAAAMVDGDAGPLLDLLDARVGRGGDGRYTDNSAEAFYAVTCLDRPYEGTVDDVRALAESWAAQAPTFGPSLAWGLLTCRDWPAEADRITSTRAKGSPPILVVSTTRDPATPFAWGERLTEQLADGNLLTLDATRHTAYGSGSACVDEAVDAYLLSGRIPEQGTVCD